MSLNYPNAPIAEALFHFDVDVPNGIKIENLAQLAPELAKEYPVREALPSDDTQQGGAVSSPVEETNLIEGYSFQSSDGLNLIQLRPKGFTYSRLNRYESWMPFRLEARKAWDFYRSFDPTLNVRAAGISYVNKIDLPRTPVDLADYLTVSPMVPASLNPSLNRMFSRIGIEKLDPKRQLDISIAVLPGDDESSPSLILTIDLYRFHSWTAETNDEMWNFLEQLRDEKNEVFESYLQDSAKEMFR